MTDVQKPLAEVEEKRLDAAAIAFVRADVGSQLFRTPWRKIAFGIALSITVIMTVCGIIDNSQTFRSPLFFMVIFMMLLGIRYCEVYKKKTEALLRLIEREAPELHAKLSKDEGT